MGALYEPHEPVDAEVRFFPIRRHRNHLVFYRPIPDGIEVLRVLHGARDLFGILAEEFGVESHSDDDETDETEK